eukprot:augustus_masked-scaffold_52-processed-gene-1.11-mRNA-1 protein AED:1.00 eAED:1.00 QI:0/-1/0/0/-1/1/1/0/488
MNQSQGSWCHSEASEGNLNDSPFLPIDEGGDCLPDFGLWINGRRWIPEGEILWDPIKVGEEEGYQVFGYFVSSCSGINGACDSSEERCSFAEGVDDSLLLKMRVYKKIDCADRATRKKFVDCPKTTTGCFNVNGPRTMLFEKLDGDFTLASTFDLFFHCLGGRKFWMEHRYMGGGRAASPVILGDGGNLHNKEYGASFWFQAHAYDNNEFVDGDFNVDIRPCTFVQEENLIPLCSEFPVLNDINIKKVGSGLAGYEHNPKGTRSNHLMVMFKEDRRMIPIENTIYKEIQFYGEEGELQGLDRLKHVNVWKRDALMVKDLQRGIDGRIEFSGMLHDMEDPRYKVLLEVGLSRGRSRLSCSKIPLFADKSFEREEPYYCYDERFATDEEKKEWTYYGRMNASVTFVDKLGGCKLSHEGYYSPQFGIGAQIKRQDFSIGKEGVTIWAKFEECYGEMSHLERTTVDVNMVIEALPKLPTRTVPCRVSGIVFP